MDSRHPLKIWIEEHSSQAKFAGEVELSESYLSEILSGRKVPSLALSSRMSKATGGFVPIEAFVKEAAE